MYQNLTFPLNVYAQILELNDVPVDYLHFGIFNDPDDDPYQAQKKSTELMFSFLPQPPASIFEIGIGLGTTQNLLLTKGYQAEGITPDLEQIKIAQDRILSHSKLHHGRFEEYTKEKEFQVIIAQESAQYINILELITGVSHLLEENGRFILVDEVSLIRDNTNFIPLHHPDYIKYICSTNNLKMIEEKDLSSQASYRMQYLLHGLEKHWQQLVDILNLSEAEIVNLKKDIIHSINQYDSGHYGYYFMAFEKTNTYSHYFRLLKNTDYDAFSSLFQTSFQHQMSKELWHWKYEKCTAPSLGCWENGQLVGNYGAFERDILFFGQPMKALQVGDTMVSPCKRGLFTKNGVFNQLVRNYAYCYIGFGAHYPISFGFPNTRAMKLAEKLGLYQPVGKMIKLHWDKKYNFSPQIFYQIRPLCMDKDKQKINLLWQNMSLKTENLIIGLRDWDYLHYRYVEKPEQSYQLFKLENRITKKMIAVFVLKFEDNQNLLVDIICDPADISLLIRSAIRVTQANQKESLYTMITENLYPYFDYFEPTQSDPEITIPHSNFTPSHPKEQVENKWWLMAGDTDFL